MASFETDVTALVAALEGVLQAPVRRQEPLAPHTSFRIGGPCDVLAEARSAEELRRCLLLAGAHLVPAQVLGYGTNVLIADSGLTGLVILNRARAIETTMAEDDYVTVWVESGCALPLLSRWAEQQGLSGLEWAEGVPGSVGGAAVGNAGAFGTDMSVALVSVEIFRPDGTRANVDTAGLGLGYRTSALRDDSLSGVVLSAILRLERGRIEDIAARMREYRRLRSEAQPHEPGAGSVFRNPPGQSAGRLIELAGMKGARIGGALVSPKHANFIVNCGGASAKDVADLIDAVRNRVQAAFGVALELEIRLLGTW